MRVSGDLLLMLGDSDLSWDLDLDFLLDVVLNGLVDSLLNLSGLFVGDFRGDLVGNLLGNLVGLPVGNLLGGLVRLLLGDGVCLLVWDLLPDDVFDFSVLMVGFLVWNLDGLSVWDLDFNLVWHLLGVRDLLGDLVVFLDVVRFFDGVMLDLRLLLVGLVWLLNGVLLSGLVVFDIMVGFLDLVFFS